MIEYYKKLDDNLENRGMTLDKILFSNIEIDSSRRNYRKLLMTNLSYLISISVFIIFSFYNIFISNNIFEGAIELFFVIPALYGFLKLKKNKNIEEAALFANYLLFITILITLFLFEFKECVIVWAFIYPFIAMSLSGSEKGIYFITLFNIIVYIGAYLYWYNTQVTIVSYIRFVAVSFIITILVYFYEKIIDNAFEKQLNLNDSLKTSVEEVRILSITDALTNLYNKRHFDTIFSKEFNRAKRAESIFVLAIIDIDNFKPYNDLYGHDYGNHALQRVGEILNQYTARSGDYAFRIGGEEFALILQASSLEDSYKYLDTIRQKIEDENIEHKSNKPYGFLTVSIGAVNVLNFETITTAVTYKKADQNLYRIKNNGRNEIKVSTI